MNEHPYHVLEHLADAGPMLEPAKNLLGLVEERVWQLYGTRLMADLPQVGHWFNFQGGETAKNLDTAQNVWRQLANCTTSTDTTVVLVGGGAWLDTASWTLANWKRGLPVVLMPTTLLAMVDASIGGKTALDYAGVKNLLGCYHFPQNVLAWPGFLETLDSRQLRSGMAEVLKVAALSSQRAWENVVSSIDHATARLNTDSFGEVILQAARAKMAIVQQDPYECGVRKSLNLGHTIGHALEAATLHASQPLLHGEAVAMGLQLEAQLAAQHFGFPQTIADTFAKDLGSLGYDRVPPKLDAETLRMLLLQDKKNQNQKVKPVFLRNWGQPVWDQFLDVDLVVTYTLSFCRG